MQEYINRERLRPRLRVPPGAITVIEEDERATSARIIRAQSSASARSTFSCNVGAGAGEEEGVDASARADVGVDADGRKC